MSQLHHPRPPARRRLATVLAAALVASLAACGVDAGQGATGELRTKAGGGDVVGSDIEVTTTTAPVTTTLPPAPDLEVEGAVDSEVNAVIANAVVELEEWWADEFPAAYDDPYEPLSGGLYAIDSGTDPTTIPCGGNDIRLMLDNAYYCPPTDSVVWDQEGLMPDMAERYGPFTTAVVIAHEWGHVIQERAAFDQPSVITELQADCFAGAWAGHVADGGSDLFEVTIDDLDQALAGVLSLRDAPGGAAEDPYAHGSGFDRVGAFQDGFESGVARCAEYEVGDPSPYQWEFSSADEAYTSGDLPLDTAAADDDILDLTFPALEVFWTKTFPELSDGDEWDPLGAPVAFEAEEPPSCAGDPVEGFVLFVCIPDRYVGYQTTGTIPDAYDQNGDFAVSTLFATQYGLDVVEQLGTAESDLAASLQGDCLAGAFAEAILPPVEDEDLALVLSPGDLDEGVAVLLSFRSAADRDRQGPGFQRVGAFRRGVLQGAEACLEITGS